MQHAFIYVANGPRSRCVGIAGRGPHLIHVSEMSQVAARKWRSDRVLNCWCLTEPANGGGKKCHPLIQIQLLQPA